MDKKTKKIIKKYFNPYNLAIIGAVIVIIVSLIIIFMPEGEKSKQKTVDGVKVVTSNTKEDEEITEEDARKLAVKQFKKLGETINKDDVQVNRIRRQGEEYYYIASPKNTLEIKILGGEITRINSVIVE